jgi:ribosome-associated toxin RatA of RatAB toxin-antitoxin module
LHGYWRFEELKEDACKVSLDLDYEFSSKLLGMMVGPVFNQIANSLVDAFCQRAEACYGKR